MYSNVCPFVIAEVIGHKIAKWFGWIESGNCVEKSFHESYKWWVAELLNSAIIGEEHKVSG